MQTATTRKLVSTLRALCSETCELGPEMRMNYLVKFAWDAANELEKLENDLASWKQTNWKKAFAAKDATIQRLGGGALELIANKVDENQLIARAALEGK
jgi:hypothetical protein